VAGGGWWRAREQLCLQAMPNRYARRTHPSTSDVAHAPIKKHLFPRSLQVAKSLGKKVYVSKDKMQVCGAPSGGEPSMPSLITQGQAGLTGLA